AFDVPVDAVRQKSAKLEEDGLVAFADQAGESGRTKRLWRLTAKGHCRFPDTHGDLTVNLIAGIRLVFGEAGLDRLIEARQRAAGTAHRKAGQPFSAPAERVRTLARFRSGEGYMAGFQAEPGGRFLLLQNTFPLCATAPT